MQKGFAAYLHKPVRRTRLYEVLVKVFGDYAHPVLNEAPINTKHTADEVLKSQRRILIVEDNSINQKVALKILNTFGYQADAVSSGREALELLHREPYDLVLMDVSMPEMDGLEATRLIRNQQHDVINPNVPIIAMTAHAYKEDRNMCLEAGMDGYLSKPINPDKLIETIAPYVNPIQADN